MSNKTMIGGFEYELYVIRYNLPATKKYEHGDVINDEQSFSLLSLQEFANIVREDDARKLQQWRDKYNETLEKQSFVDEYENGHLNGLERAISILEETQ